MKQHFQEDSVGIHSKASSSLELGSALYREGTSFLGFRSLGIGCLRCFSFIEDL